MRGIDKGFVLKKEKSKITTILRAVQVIGALALVIFATFAPIKGKTAFIALIIAMLLMSISIIYEIGQKFAKGELLNAQLLLFLACIGAAVFGNLSYATLTLIIFEIFVMIFDHMQKTSDKVMTDINELLPTTATIFAGGKEKEVASSEIKKGDIIIVRNKEVVPTDSRVFVGASHLDITAICGERTIAKAGKGEFVFGGGINLGETLQLEAVNDFEDSAIYLICEKMANAVKSESDLQRRIIKYSKVASAGLAICAIFTALVLPYITGDDFSKWAYISSIVIAGASFSALSDMIKNKMAKAVWKLYKRGIITDTADKIYKASKADRVIAENRSQFDRGRYKLTYIKNIDCTKEEILTYAAHISSFADDPTSEEIVKGFLEVVQYEGIKDPNPIKKNLVTSFENIKGKGFSGYLAGHFICVGNEKLMKMLNIRDAEQSDEYTFVHVACDQKYLGYIALKYMPQEKEEELYKLWSAAGIKKYALLDGIENDENIYEDISLDKKKNDNIFLVKNSHESSKIEEKQDIISIKTTIYDSYRLPQSFAFAVMKDDSLALINIKEEARATVASCKAKVGIFVGVKSILYIASIAVGAPIAAPVAAEGILRLLLGIK